ncbi:WbqC family protein [Paracrocinitomix mangrovi]|uniref:WbqC family protein n=1 Tax=Paracrocinitomix mangrovi TaxID=2862509 RepID=UPI001C8EA3D9|nr:WbqC family protein [Paracrocinitomix mangrovi]UKN01632.1 WbqC family protein [Paracrocinitomix mangrovi]
MTNSLILPSFYFGNIEYFYHLLKTTNAIIDIAEPYQKQTYRTRMVIGSANGIQSLTIPVIRPNGKQTLMNEVEISYTENWRKDHLKAIEAAYARSPYYEYYIDQLTEIMMSDQKLLYELNYRLNEWLINKIGLTVNLTLNTSPIPLDQNKDLRALLHPKLDTGFRTYHYIQPFEERHGFLNNLSILDLLFNEGPNSITILSESGY